MKESNKFFFHFFFFKPEQLIAWSNRLQSDVRFNRKWIIILNLFIFVYILHFHSYTHCFFGVLFHFFLSFFYLLGPMCLFYFSKKKPMINRKCNIRMPNYMCFLYHLLLALAICICFAILENWLTSALNKWLTAYSKWIGKIYPFIYKNISFWWLEICKSQSIIMLAVSSSWIWILSLMWV